MIHALIDADILVYRVGFSADKNRDSEEYALKTMRGAIRSLVMEGPLLEKTETHKLYLTGKGNFRYDVATTVPYKGNRKSPKPRHYDALRKFLEEEEGAEVITGMEADDELAIQQTKLGDDSVIVTIDKDLKQVPGWHYNFVKHDLFYMNQEEADLWLYKQIVMGDAVDNILGVRGIGDKKADKLLRGKTCKEMWDICVEKLGSVERAMENAQLVYMLRKEGEYWQPPE